VAEQGAPHIPTYIYIYTHSAIYYYYYYHNINIRAYTDAHGENKDRILLLLLLLLYYRERSDGRVGGSERGSGAQSRNMAEKPGARTQIKGKADFREK